MREAALLAVADRRSVEVRDREHLIAADDQELARVAQHVVDLRVPVDDRLDLALRNLGRKRY